MKTYTISNGLGDWINNSVRSSFEDADIVLIPGGSDVNPELYGHTRISGTSINLESDKIERSLINDAIKAGKFIIGICKGSQMLTARSGGWLVQDMLHGGWHKVTTHDGKVLEVNSSHHQMSYPYDLPEDEYKLLAWAEGISRYYRVGPEKSAHEDPLLAYDENGIFKEPEVIWYPKIRGLAVQSHPEWQSSPEEFNVWLNELVLTLFNKES